MSVCLRYKIQPISITRITRQRRGLGPIGTDSQHIYGFVKHTTLVVTESGLPLGCLTDCRLGSGHAEAKQSQSECAADEKRELQMD